MTRPCRAFAWRERTIVVAQHLRLIRGAHRVSDTGRRTVVGSIDVRAKREKFGDDISLPLRRGPDERRDEYRASSGDVRIAGCGQLVRVPPLADEVVGRTDISMRNRLGR